MDDGIVSTHKGTTYPLSSYLSYSKVSPSHRASSLATSSHFEPNTFSQAIKLPHLKEAMQAKISALEANIKWTLTELSPGKYIEIDCHLIRTLHVST